MSMDEPPVRGALRPIGKTIHVQHLGTVVGRRGAGLNNLPGEVKPMNHTFNHYGKNGFGGLDGGGMGGGF